MRPSIIQLKQNSKISSVTKQRALIKKSVSSCDAQLQVWFHYAMFYYSCLTIQDTSFINELFPFQGDWRSALFEMT